MMSTERLKLSEFPPKTNQDDRFYHELNPSDKKYIKEHLKLSGELRKWVNIRSYLIDQVHKKKSVHKGRKFIPQGLTKEYYCKYLYHSRRVISNYGELLGSLRGYLEDTIPSGLSTADFNYIPIYYCDDEKPEKLLYDSFNRSEWRLTKGLGMNPKDIEIFEIFKKEYLLFCRKAYNRLSNIGKKLVIKELSRTEKIMNSIE